MPSYTFPVVSLAAFIICTTFISGNVLALAISNQLVAWFTSGDVIFNWVIVGLGMLEIGARQLHNWRLHEPPTSFPSANLASCQHADTVAWCHVITSDYQGGTQAPQS